MLERKQSLAQSKSQLQNMLEELERGRKAHKATQWGFVAMSNERPKGVSLVLPDSGVGKEDILIVRLRAHLLQD